MLFWKEYYYERTNNKKAERSCNYFSNNSKFICYNNFKHLYSLSIRVTEYRSRFTFYRYSESAYYGCCYLFMSIILFSKKYNNTLIVATATLLIYNIIGLFLNVTPFVIFDILFYLLLIAYTYVAINKQGTPLREKVVKFRYIIPLFQFALVLHSVIQTLQSNYERALETVSSYTEGTISIFEILSPFIISSIISFLPVLCYIWHVNWLADPYEKTESISTDNQL